MSAEFEETLAAHLNSRTWCGRELNDEQVKEIALSLVAHRIVADPAEVERLREMTTHMGVQITEADAGHNAALARLAAVEALHVMTPRDPLIGFAKCAHDRHDWPCATHRAVLAEGASTSSELPG